VALTLVTPPDGYPVTLDEVKDQLRIEHTDDDAKLMRLIARETEHLDGWWGLLNKALKPQTWELSLDAFPAGAIQIPLGPLIEVLSVMYDDADGNEQTLPPANYVVDTAVENGWVVPIAGEDWPATLDRVNAVRVLYIAGWPDVPDNSSGAESGAMISTVPDPIKGAIMLRVGAGLEHLENVEEPEDRHYGKSAADRLLRGRMPLLLG
jgi:uncharacterized phiE125 gp8 family phage protein